MLVAETTWTDVVIAVVHTLPAILAAVFAYLIRRSIRTPSGDPLGQVMERTHEASVADLAVTTDVHRVVTGVPRGGQEPSGAVESESPPH